MGSSEGITRHVVPIRYSPLAIRPPNDGKLKAGVSPAVGKPVALPAQ